MRKINIALLSLIFLSVAVLCVQASEKGSMKDSGEHAMKEEAGAAQGSEKGSMTEHPDAVAKAMAMITGTAEGSMISGHVMLVETPEGIYATAHLANVPDEGEHGIHIHANGSCDDGGKAAGGHYNPNETEHGLWSEDGPENAHPGDMGNIQIAENGYGEFHAFLSGLTLTGDEYNVSGRAIILHAKGDDFGQPTGNAGGRIGCGVIQVAE